MMLIPGLRWWRNGATLGLKGLKRGRGLLFALLALGVYFRLGNLERKPYWNDEAATLQMLSGLSTDNMRAAVWSGNPISPEDLLKFQKISPGTDLADVLRNTATEQISMAPLYYASLRIWSSAFGHSARTLKLFSALAGILALPLVYLLVLELFDDSETADLGAALLAVSPFHVFYAQEARPYSLWTATILFSCLLLLRAQRKGDIQSWWLYGMSVTLGLLTHHLFILVLAAHGLYNRLQHHRLAPFAKTAIGAFALASPWYLFASGYWLQARQIMKWTEVVTTFRHWLGSFTFHIGTLFFDLGLRSHDSETKLALMAFPVLAVLVLVGLSLARLSRQPGRPWPFIGALIIVTALPLILADLIVGGHRANISRYLTPTYLGLQLAVIFFLANPKRRLAAAGVLAAGVISCTLYSQAEIWSSKGDTAQDRETALLINQAARPLLATDADPRQLLPLAHMLRGNVKILFCRTLPKSQVRNFSDVFLYKASPELLAALEANIRPLPDGRRRQLWRIPWL